MATLAIVTHPANMIMTIVPQAVTALASFERIQDYLLEGSFTDQRRVVGSPPGSENPILHDLSMSMNKGTITICSGPVGSGKTALARACDQSTWLPHGTIRELISSFAEDVDLQRYHEAVTACCLEQDLASLPHHDGTVVGTQGINLSGGQRQRLALARLLYSQPEVAILDDPFAALDGTTEATVVENLIGEHGWLRRHKTTVFLATNSAQYFHFADQIAVLDGGQLKSLGSWQELKSQLTEIRKFTFGDDDEEKAAVIHHQSPQEQAKALRNRDAEQDLYRRTGDFSLYGYYVRSTGVWSALLVIGCTSIYSFFITVPAYWLKWWTGSEPGQLSYYASGYVLLAVVAWAATSGTMWSMSMQLAIRSGRNLHQSLLTAVMGAPFSFFSTTEIGVTINRFGQDISLVDRNLPHSFMTLCTQVFKLSAQILVLLQRWLNLVLDLTASAIAIGIIGLAVGHPSSMSGADVGVALNLILVANNTLISLVYSWAGLEMSLGAVARIRDIDLHAPREDLPTESTVPDATWSQKGELCLDNVTVYQGSNHAVVRDVNLHIRGGRKVVMCGRTGSGKSSLLMALLRLTNYTGSITIDGLDVSLMPRSVLRRQCFITIAQDSTVIPEATLAFNLNPSSLASEEVLREALEKVGLRQVLSSDGGGTETDVLERTLSSLLPLSVGQLQLLAMARAIVQKRCSRASTPFIDHDGMHEARPIVLLDEAMSSLDPATEATIYDLIESEFVDAGHTVIIVAHRLSALSGKLRPGTDLVAFLDRGCVAQVGTYEDLAEFVTTAEEASSR
ncbi:hypothetical protein JDV02_010462 [Purpureocillium takamizusanense]|uniref:ABC transporter n=1 Tax=Purpureocillium takamizusanense TaxID=2060973 RepID=A0A9Q8VHF3_9HYPO|nr:uncharacterized protein JDV02_010462 [Purpureocillium takamizusanense]UNI24737.1 hypothetical protein JDV02_010462 [Purpureocillium takamizusanense]